MVELTFSQISEVKVGDKLVVYIFILLVHENPPEAIVLKFLSGTCYTVTITTNITEGDRGSLAY